jgi:hypothetical protein
MPRSRARPRNAAATQSRICRQYAGGSAMLAAPRTIEPSVVAEQSLATIRGILVSRYPSAVSRIFAGYHRR